METLIKCIVIASGNDASVAMAEYIAGSEDAFVQIMNERAKGLGMTGTHFVDCCGLTESPEHLTTARILPSCPGTDYKISADPCVFHNLDGEHYPCDKTGNEGIWASNTNKLLKWPQTLK